METLVDPNLNAEVYKNMTPADRPPVLDKNLEFISVHSEKSVILGATNMTDRYWSGTVWFYDKISNFQRDSAYTAVKTESGVCCGAHLDSDKFIIGEDNGVLQILKLDEVNNMPRIMCVGYTCQHDSSLTTLSVSSDKLRAVTSGMDCCIKLWDLDELLAMYSYCAHTDMITGVDMQPKSDSIFVSVSMDSDCLMWDVRLPKPAQRILDNQDCPLTAVTWNPIGELVVVGGIDGSIKVIDHRNTSTPLKNETTVFSRALRKLVFNPVAERSQLLACCSDDTPIKVINTSEESSVLYENNNHKDFVRGLAWCNDRLLSCSWDEFVLIHNI